MASSNQTSCNNLSLQLFALYAPETSSQNVAMGMDSVFKGFLALYYGTAGKTRDALNHLGFNDKYFIYPDGSSSTTTAISLLSRYGHVGEIRDHFRNYVRNLCSEHFLHTVITPEDTSSQLMRTALAHNINLKFSDMTDEKIDQMETSESVNLYDIGPVSMHVRSVFKGAWLTFFDREILSDVPFILPGSQEKTKVQMMNNTRLTQALVSNMEQELDATIVKIPYRENSGYFIAIMPDQPSNKEELLALSSKIDLSKLLNSFYKVECNELQMPKFTVETDLTLDEAGSGPGEGLGRIEDLKEFKSDTADYSNMFEGGFPDGKLISIRVKTTVDNHQTGTDVVSDFDLIAYDCHIENPRKIVLNKPMLYLIVSPNGYVKTLGTFVQP